MRKGLIQVPLKLMSGFGDFNVVERYNPILHCQYATQWQLFFSYIYILKEYFRGTENHI